MKPKREQVQAPVQHRARPIFMDVTERFCEAVTSGKIRLVDLVNALSKNEGTVRLFVRLDPCLDIRDVSDVLLSMDAPQVKVRFVKDDASQTGDGT